MVHKRIPARTLLEIVPNLDNKVTNGAAINIARKRHCSKIHAAGYCNSKCEETCGDTLRELFQDLNAAQDVRSYPALLTWLSRVKAADLIEFINEQAKHEPENNKNEWGIPEKAEDQNSFGVLAEIYSLE